MDINKKKNLNKKTPHVADLVEKFDEARISEPKTTTKKGLESGLSGASPVGTTTTTTTTTVRQPAASLGDFPISGIQETGLESSSFAQPSTAAAQPSYGSSYQATPVASSSFGSSYQATPVASSSFGSSYQQPSFESSSKPSSSYESSYQAAAPSASTSYDSSYKSGATPTRSYASGDFKQSDSARLVETEREATMEKQRAAAKFDRAKTDLKEGAASTAIAAKDMAAGAAIKTKETAVAAGEAIRDNAQWAAERAEVKWDQTKEVAAEAAVTIGGKISTAATVVKEDAVYVGGKVAETASAVASEVANKAVYAKDVAVSVKDQAAHATAENLRWAADKIDPLPKEQSAYVGSDRANIAAQPGGLASSTAETEYSSKSEFSSKTQ